MALPFLLFNDVGGSEVVLIFLIVLIFFGPKSIPGIAKTIGRAIYTIRNASDDLKEEIKKAGVDVKKDLKIEAILREEEATINQPMDQLFSGIENTVHYRNERIQTTVSQNTPTETTNDPNSERPNVPQESKPNDVIIPTSNES
jgi:sec-independent protein translocase protein TatA